ncbi:MAG: hypothetical protein GX022_07920 [Clostridiaceae bacterium]|nr:hypothetical protein [Clostridiaceae bacterium]
MSFFTKLFGTDKSQKDTNSRENISRSESAVSLQYNGKDNEIVAVIMAALMNILNDSTGELRIKSIRRTNRRSPVWNIAGRDEYIASKL